MCVSRLLQVALEDGKEFWNGSLVGQTSSDGHAIETVSFQIKSRLLRFATEHENAGSVFIFSRNSPTGSKTRCIAIR